MTLEFLEERLAHVIAAMDHLTFGQLLRGCRECLGIKLKAAADFAKMDETRLRNMETNNFIFVPSLTEMTAIADVYGLDVDKLFFKARKVGDTRRVA